MISYPVLRRVAVLIALAIPVAASGADEELEAQLKAMQDRLGQLEQKIESQEDELTNANQRLEAQQGLIQRQGIALESTSGLASFLETIEVGGWVAASYFYNFNDPDGRALGGSNTGGFAYPFRPDANSFSLDQVWFEIERPVSEENRAGFRLDFVYGKDAGLLSGDFGAGDGFSGNDFELYQGYVQYMAPIGEGVTFQFGKFATLIGAEVVQSPYNFNITRGHVYNLFQPITHTGILASTSMGGLDVSLGAVNETRSFPAADIDLNKDKAVLWSIGGSAGEVVSWSFNGTWGSADSGTGIDTPAGDKELILDAIIGFDPTENFSAYINADYIDTQNSRGTDVDGYGIAVAGRYAFTERMGFATRVEWVSLDDFFGSGSDLEVWGVTGTLDYKLTDHLMVRGEVRYDRISDGGDLFVTDNSFGVGVAEFDEDDQITAGVEVVYSF
jgi:hypothetical protein